MQKFEKIIFIVLGIFLTFGLAFFLIGYFKPKKAGILIETTPAASVFIDGVQVGRTPYETTRTPSEITIKLVPESLDKPLAPYETKVTLGSGIKTVIKREFAESEETASGEVISFEKVGGSQASLAVVSIPDSAQVLVDGQSRGFAPVKVSEITPGDHQIAVAASGYKEKTLTVRTIIGYKLTAVVKLAQSPSGFTPSVHPEGQATPEPKTIYVEILETPSGFLRVREEPNTTSKELARVKPGEKFLLIEEDKQTGWFKIEYLPAQAGKQDKKGWISNEYARKLSP